MDISADCQQLQRGIQTSLAAFHQHCDVNRLLVQLRALVLVFIENLVVECIGRKFRDQGFLNSIKALAAKSALRFKGFKTTSIRLLTGKSVSIESPYFARVRPAGRRSRKRTAKTGCHTALLYMGFLDRCSAVVTSPAVQAALLCPSFQIAEKTLTSFGIDMDTKTIERLCRHTGDRAMTDRTRIALSDADTCAGRNLLVCIDGGRLRERRAQKGRRPKRLKRQGYHTDWREPTQLVIQWLNADGGRCDQIAPIYDATMADTDAAFALLEDYLRQIDAGQAGVVVFCADGARKYWSRFGKLARKLDLNAHLEVIDYTHAKQNLNEIIDKLPAKLSAAKTKAIADHWKDLLWHGDIDALGEQIDQHIKGPKKRSKALTKFKNYFLENRRNDAFSPQHPAVRTLGHHARKPAGAQSRTTGRVPLNGVAPPAV